MATALDIISGALKHLGVKASESAITDAEAIDGLVSLNDMGAELEVKHNLGFVPLSSLTDTVNIPRYADAAFKAILAVRLAPEYSKPLTPELMALAMGTKTAMIDASTHIGDVDYPSTLPRGSGNEDSELLGDKFFNQENGTNF